MMRTPPPSITAPPLRLHQRWLIRRDFPEVLSIEAACLAPRWTEDDLLRMLRHRNTIGMVCEDTTRSAGRTTLDNPIVGYMVYSLNRYSLEVLHLAVAPAYRRRGVGRAMAAKVAGKLSPDRRILAETVVRESNLSAALFWRACGWQATGVLYGRFRDGGPDGAGEDGWHFQIEAESDDTNDGEV